jgi:hypothetical protein
MFNGYNAGGLRSAYSTLNGADWTFLSSGSYWTPPNFNFSNPVYCVEASDTYVYIAGPYTSSGVPNSKGFCRVNRRTYEVEGLGDVGNVYALTASGSNMWIGGSFNTLTGFPQTALLTVHNGNTFTSVGSFTFNQVVYAIKHDPPRGRTYIGGSFTTINGAAMNRVAMWDGSSWYAL